MHLNTLRVLALLREGERDAAEILDGLRDLDADAAPSLPAFYRCLKDAVEAGWVRIAGSEAAPGPGRPRQIYALTDSGVRAAEAEARRLQSLAALALGAAADAGS